MSEIKTFFLEIVAFSRKTSRSPESILSSISVTAIVFSLTILVLLAAPVFMTKELSLLFIYGLAIFEALLGLRVGFLRIGAYSNEQFLSVPSRFWKRSFPYLFPAILIPLPLSIAVTSFLATNPTNWWLILLSIIASYMLFFFLGIAWSMIIRVIARRVIPRLIILILSATVLVSVLSSGDFIFRVLLISQNYSDYLQIVVLLAELSTIVFLVIITDITLNHLPITVKKFGKYWPIFLVGKSHGHGQGSSSFFITNKLFVRSTAFHRRISSLILSLMLFMLIIYAVLYVGGSQVDENIIIITLLIFTAVSSLLISRPSAKAAHRTIDELSHLPVDKKKILVGSWLSGLAWQIGVATLFFGLVATWTNISASILYLVLIGATTQHVLFFGWSEKLSKAHHHNLSLFAVFALTVLLGILPVLLLPLSGFTQTVLIQLIWLGSIGILLHITTGERTVKYD